MDERICARCGSGLVRLEADDIADWARGRCSMLYTEDWLRELTKERFEQIFMGWASLKLYQKKRYDNAELIKEIDMKPEPVLDKSQGRLSDFA